MESDQYNGDLGDLDLERVEDFGEVDGLAQAVGAAAVNPYLHEPEPRPRQAQDEGEDEVLRPWRNEDLARLEPNNTANW